MTRFYIAYRGNDEIVSYGLAKANATGQNRLTAPCILLINNTGSLGNPLTFKQSLSGVLAHLVERLYRIENSQRH